MHRRTRLAAATEIGPAAPAGAALNDVVAGHVATVFDNLPSALPFIEDNRLIAVAIAAPQRLTLG